MSGNNTSLPVSPETRDLLRMYKLSRGCNTYSEAIKELMDEAGYDTNTEVDAFTLAYGGSGAAD